MDRSDLEKVAELARLRLDGAELEGLTRDCKAILEYFEAIRRLDVTGTAPAGALEQPANLRADRVDCDPLESPLEEVAPAWSDGFFVLPRLPALDADAVDEGEGS